MISNRKPTIPENSPLHTLLFKRWLIDQLPSEYLTKLVLERKDRLDYLIANFIYPLDSSVDPGCIRDYNHGLLIDSYVKFEDILSLRHIEQVEYILSIYYNPKDSQSRNELDENYYDPTQPDTLLDPDTIKWDVDFGDDCIDLTNIDPLLP